MRRAVKSGFPKCVRLETLLYNQQLKLMQALQALEFHSLFFFFNLSVIPDFNVPNYNFRLKTNQSVL